MVSQVKMYGPVPDGKRGSWQEYTGKNPDNFRPEYCFHVPAISGVSLQDTVTFPHLSCRILRDPVTGIFDLGSS